MADLSEEEKVWLTFAIADFHGVEGLRTTLDGREQTNQLFG